MTKTDFVLKKIKIAVFLLLIFTTVPFAFSQNYNLQEEENLTFSKSLKKNFFLTGGLCTVISTGQKSFTPVLFCVGAGYSFKINPKLYLDTRLAIYSDYYGWNEAQQIAQPAEVENRTSTSINLAIDLPFVACFNFGKHTLRAGGGIGLIPKINFLSREAEGFEDEFSLINKYLWSYARWVYPQMTLSYSALLFNGWKAGLDLRYYLPLTSLIEGRGLNDSVIQLCFRLGFKE